jgi:DNA-binding protein HU-beta
MNKSELVALMAEKAGLTKADAERALNAFIEGVTGALKGGKKVALTGFGSFEVRYRAARDGVNPKTGQKIRIPATKVPAFKAGKALKDAVK